MTFKDFMQQDEQSLVKAHNGPLQLIKAHIKAAKPVTGCGSTVGRIMSKALSGIGPARAVKITSVAGPMTSPSLLK